MRTVSKNDDPPQKLVIHTHTRMHTGDRYSHTLKDGLAEWREMMTRRRDGDDGECVSDGAMEADDG